MADYHFHFTPSGYRKKLQNLGFLGSALLSLGSIQVSAWWLLSAVSLFWLAQQSSAVLAPYRCNEKGYGATASGKDWQLLAPVIITPIWLSYRAQIGGKKGPWQGVFVDQLQRADWARLQRISLSVNAAGLK